MSTEPSLLCPCTSPIIAVYSRLAWRRGAAAWVYRAAAWIHGAAVHNHASARREAVGQDEGEGEGGVEGGDWSPALRGAAPSGVPARGAARASPVWQAAAAWHPRATRAPESAPSRVVRARSGRVRARGAGSTHTCCSRGSSSRRRRESSRTCSRLMPRASSRAHGASTAASPPRRITVSMAERSRGVNANSMTSAPLFTSLPRSMEGLFLETAYLK